MCRWMAWKGQPVLIEELLFKTQHGLIDQSLHSGWAPRRRTATGSGWAGTGRGQGRACTAASRRRGGDANLRHLAGHLESPLFLSHVRAALGSPVQQTNCHPFRHGRWLFVHNGFVAGFHGLRRELMLAVDPDLFADVQGSTDSEVILHLALTEGLEEDPLTALERALGRVEAAAERHGIDSAIQASIGVSDGERVWAVRYSTEGRSRTLFVSGDVHALRQLHPDNPRLARMRDEDCVVVSEPFSDLPGAWVEIPESTALVVHGGGEREQRPFRPSRPSLN